MSMCICFEVNISTRFSALAVLIRQRARNARRRIKHAYPKRLRLRHMKKVQAALVVAWNLHTPLTYSCTCHMIRLGILSLTYTADGRIRPFRHSIGHRARNKPT
jgi:hypothetical protein